MSKINSGYEGNNIPSGFNIPPMGIEETDRSVFKLFDEKLSFQVDIDNETTKVPVVFSTGERFALTRRNQPIRDKNNALILPIISIHRKSIDISPNQGGYGTAIASRDQSSYIIKKRLSSKDRDYQRVINKLRLGGQDDVANEGNFLDDDIFPGNDAKAGKLASRRNKNNLSLRIDPAGDLLRKGLGDNIFEIITGFWKNAY